MSVLLVASCVAHAAPSAEGWLVWRAASDKEPARTSWVDDAGKVLATREGVVLAAGDALWLWREVPISSESCPCSDDPRACVYQEGGAGAQLVDLETGRARDLTARWTEVEEGETSRTQSAGLMGSVGDLLFYVERSELSTCHGNVMSFPSESYRALDLRRGEPVALTYPGQAGSPAVLGPVWKDGRLAWRVQRAAEADCPNVARGGCEELGVVQEAPAGFSGPTEPPAALRPMLERPEASGFSRVRPDRWAAFQRQAPAPRSAVYRGPNGVLETLSSRGGTLYSYVARWTPEEDTAGACACQDEGASLKLDGATAQVSGSPSCCTGSFAGERLVRVDEVPVCAVSAARAPFHTAPNPATARKAWVVQGDAVEVLPSSTSADGAWVRALYRGAKADTSGWLATAQLSCLVPLAR